MKRRIIVVASLLLAVLSSSAFADRGRGNRGRDHNHRDNRSGGVVVRDHRNDHRWERPRRVERTRVVRRPVYVNRDRYVFNGYTRVYHRPTVRYRYYDYRVRPQVLVEQMEPVPGYIWVTGGWAWNNYEWIWQPGHYEVDQNYDDDFTQYDSDGDGYVDSYYENQ